MNAGAELLVVAGEASGDRIAASLEAERPVPLPDLSSIAFRASSTGAKAPEAGNQMKALEIPDEVWKIYPDLSHAHDWEAAIAATSFAFTCTAYQPTRSGVNVMGSAVSTSIDSPARTTAASSPTAGPTTTRESGVAERAR